MNYQPGDMRGASHKPDPAPPRKGPPQCARGCGWVNDYAEPGFVCRKCQLWEGLAMGEPSAPSPPSPPPPPLPTFYVGARFRHADGRVIVITGRTAGYWEYDIAEANGSSRCSDISDANAAAEVASGTWAPVPVQLASYPIISGPVFYVGRTFRRSAGGGTSLKKSMGSGYWDVDYLDPYGDVLATHTMHEDSMCDRIDAGLWLL